MTTKFRIRIVNLRIGVGGVKTDVFSNFRGLAGDFYKDTYEPKLFGMHIGSVLSGLEAGNVNNDHKMPILGCKTTNWKGKICIFFRISRSCRGHELGHMGGKLGWYAYEKCFEWFGRAAAAQRRCAAYA